MVDQAQGFFRNIAHSRVAQGHQDIMGSVWKVWRQGGEQKIQTLIGQTLDGSNILGPWLKVETQHGTHREQHKFHKGQNVKISGGIVGDQRQATITPHGENTAHPEPKYANDYHHTYSHVSYHFRRGPAHHDRFIVQSQSGGSSGSQAQARFGDTGSSSSGGGSTGGTDPYQDSIVVHRHGKKPQVQQQQGPWDGPDPNSVSDGNQETPQHLHWAGNKGEAPDLGSDKVHHVQYGGKTKTRHTDGMKQSSVQSSTFAGRLAQHDHLPHLLLDQYGDPLFPHLLGAAGEGSGAGVDQSATENVLTAQYNVSHVGQQSYHYIDNQQIDTATGSHYINGTQTSWLHTDGVNHQHGSSCLVTKHILHGSHPPPTASFQGIFHRLGVHPDRLTKPVVLHDHLGEPLKVIEPLGDPNYEGDDFWVENGAALTAAYSQDHPPSETDAHFVGTGVPYNGFMWTDTTSGITYTYYVTLPNLPNAVQFDGTNDGIIVPYGGPLAPPLSVSVRFKTTVANRIIVATSDSASCPPTDAVYFEHLLYVRDDGKLQGGWWDGFSSSLCTSINAVNDGNWHNAVIAISSTAVTLYLDKVLQGTVAFVGTPESATNTFSFGVGHGGWPNLAPGADWFNGALTDLRIYNRELTAQDVIDIGNGTTISDGLIANYAMQDPTAANVDSQGTYNGTTFGTALTQVAGPMLAVWAEGGGKVAFPPTPTLNELFSIKVGGVPINQWVWNGIGWQHPRHLWMTDDDLTMYSDIQMLMPALTVTGAITGATLNGTIDGGVI